jgi:hypothetical protein
LQSDISWQWMPGMWLDLKYILRNEEIAGVNNRSNIFTAGIRINALRRDFWF